MKKAMISQPMRGKTNEEILETRRKAIQFLEDHNYKFVNSFITREIPGEVVNSPMWYLAQAIERMSKCHTVYFVDGWESARGCLIEYHIAKAYGLETLFEKKS